MANIIQEPADNNPDTAAWQQFLFRTTFQGGGFMRLLLANLNTPGIPEVKKGSRLEVNGSFYVCSNETDEAVDTGEIQNNDWVFVYAVPQADSVIFKCGNIRPSWDIGKSAWYDGMNRCVAKMWYHTDNLFYMKRVTASYEDMFEDNFESVPSSGGVLETAGTPEGLIASIPAGVYRYEIKGGKGGRGGFGYNGDTPGEPSEPLEKNGTFFAAKAIPIIVKQGEGGGNGLNGATHSYSSTITRTGGGSGANGGSSILWIDKEIITAPGTQGTAGTAARGGSHNGQGGAVVAMSDYIITTTINFAPRVDGNKAPNLSVYNGPYATGATVSGGAGGTTNTENDGWARIFKILDVLKPGDFA
jgi:hypothetical protein